ncbi:MAG: SafA/ExsA family spore coat assembly protein [Bacilli bacterium]|nr:SafA/ExsA family spore coat assembly protein [Bacilli bacterium]MDD4406494.1 SafA/ExsA family spore coat assembly protein [Bacilli bacterium]
MTTYIVMQGDTMWQIATKYGIELNKLLLANPQITNPTLIYPGQIINIPQNNTLTYTVMPGDSMWDIAQKQGLNLTDLVAKNPQITNPAFITPGQIINISYTGENPDVSNDIKSLELEVIRLVNSERERAGITPLIENNNLNNIARTKSQDFINNNYFSHNSPIYSSPFDMLDSYGIRYTAAAENIASGQRDPIEVMHYWMGSSGHKANILNPTLNQIGVGVARDKDGNLYWTQMFIRS